MKPATLKKRSEFLRIRGGARWSCGAFVLEAKPRESDGTGPVAAGPRFGYTVTKQIGKANVRNRVRRRLRAVVTALASERALPNFDYVLIARLNAIDRPFADLQKDLEQAFDRVHHPGASRRSRRPSKAPSTG